MDDNGCHYRIIEADCREVMPVEADAIVTDPPYGLSFMGSDWDHEVPGQSFWEQALECVPPGGHMLAFGGTRKWHRLAVAIEDAGWELRDTLMWLYGTGFPKSHDVSKAIDREAGVEREITGTRETNVGMQGGNFANKAQQGTVEVKDEPATDAAERWEGWGTALKPGWEPILLCRKPPDGTVAENVQQHSTGGLNIDECRIGTNESWEGCERDSGPSHALRGGKDGSLNNQRSGSHPQGRWPGNVVLDPESAEMLDEQSGESTRTGGQIRTVGMHEFRGHEKKTLPGNPGFGDTGGASRFFYTAKASRAERNAGLQGDDNHHPTVKPVDLLRWLCRMVTPPRGTVFDPFCGSGSTGIAAVLEGFEVVGCELDPEDEGYAEIARKRIEWAHRTGDDFVEAHKTEQKQREEREQGQKTLWEAGQ